MISKESASIFLDTLILIKLKDRDANIVGKLIDISDSDIILEHPRHGKSVFSLDTIMEIQSIKNIDGGGDR